MSKVLKQLQVYWNKLALRERVIVVVAMLAVAVMVWSELLYRPNSNNIKLVEQALTATDNKLASVQAEIKTAQAELKKDPDADNKTLLAAQIEEGSRLDKMLERTSIKIVSAQEMTALLKEMLVKQAGLAFVSLENRPAVPDFIDEANRQADSDDVITVFRHGVTLKVEGSYSDALAYMKTLELLPWRFFWEAVEIEADGYPKVLITLDVYTLGFRRGLLGV